MSSRLGIVAGGGTLPARLIAACRAVGREVFVLALEGQADPAVVADAPHEWIRLGAGERAIALLRAVGVEELTLAGSVQRPSLASLRPDRLTAGILARIGLRALGDDSLLRHVIHAIEEQGFRVTGPDTILADMLAPEGIFGSLAPDDVAREDIRRGLDIARALGMADVGQAVVVQQGIALAVEAIEGTDAMLARAGSLRRDGPGGVLVKTSKPQQDRRVDLPTIGPVTIDRAAAAGLRGIAVEAGSTFVVDRAALTAAANTAGLFVIGVPAATPR